MIGGSGVEHLAGSLPIVARKRAGDIHAHGGRISRFTALLGCKAEAWKYQRQSSQTLRRTRRREPAGDSISANPQIFCGRFASVFHLMIARLGVLIERAKASLLDCRDVNKDVLAAAGG